MSLGTLWEKSLSNGGEEMKEGIAHDANNRERLQRNSLSSLEDVDRNNAEQYSTQQRLAKPLRALRTDLNIEARIYKAESTVKPTQDRFSTHGC